MSARHPVGISFHTADTDVFHGMIKKYFKLLVEAGHECVDDNVVKLSASLAYYTVFAIGPLLLVVVSFAGLFFEQAEVTDKIYFQVKTLVGSEAATQILSIINNMRSGSAAKFSVIGIVVLIFGATGVFADIQESVNFIWSIKAKPKKSWLKFLKNRLLSFSLIIGIGFLMMVTLTINTLTVALTDRLLRMFDEVAVMVFRIVNSVILFMIITFLFAVIYKVLPDAKIRWKDALIGACFTGILFLIGKFVIGFYLGNSTISTTYGAAAAIIIILTWVYYTAMILYFGAEFTKVYALNLGGGIEPYETAVFIIKREAKELPHSSGNEN
ncbi:YihY/virulence factor BrkB family protein [Polluticoccus soli]|uniref:YihY/virulence factor BrkB family protein n=1 Tax=Polluticoccus soli TaxID=3034150 RepID=UPI0023E2B13E|nr:YihY/virulence factor BrkB family protein [Flavipsychrobacter sp. JY13-12]